MQRRLGIKAKVMQTIPKSLAQSNTPLAFWELLDAGG